MREAVLQERILAKVDKPDDEDACWLWLGFIQPNGYGSIWNGERPEQVHRVVYRIAAGPIPAGHEIDHICHVRRCVNPKHLRCLTHRDNIRRSNAIMGINARKVSCKRGHVLAGDNLKITRQKTRQCRECLRMHARNARARRKANG